MRIRVYILCRCVLIGFYSIKFICIPTHACEFTMLASYNDKVDSTGSERLTIEGPNADIHGDSDDRGDEATVEAISPSADGVTIDGFEFTGDDSQLMRLDDEDGVTIQNNVFGEEATGQQQIGGGLATGDPITNLVIRDNKFDRTEGTVATIQLFGLDDVVIEDNVADGQYDEGGDAEDDTRFLQLDPSTANGSVLDDVTISGNEVENFGGVGLQVANIPDNADVVIKDNTVRNAVNERPERGAIAFGGEKRAEDGLTVEDNTLEDLDADGGPGISIRDEGEIDVEPSDFDEPNTFNNVDTNVVDERD